MRLFASIALLLIASLSYGQESVRDLTHVKNRIEKRGVQAKLVKNKFYYTPDTLTIPIIDDFSSNKFKTYPTTGTDSLKISKYTTLLGTPIPDSIFSLDTTYYFTHTADTTGDTTFIKVALKDTVLLFTTDTNFLTTTDTVRLFPKYNVQDTTWLSKKDTIATIINLNKTDSTLFKVVAADVTNTNIWLDNNVYITNHFAVKPPSIGAAVFEGLDSLGLPYDTITESYGLADKLTSKPINLTTVGNSNQLFLSFFYQPQGLGAEAPDKKDSLILEFKTGTTNWSRQWFVLGESKFKDFERVTITVDPKFYISDFQFRFKNYATLSGNLDVWLLDYVILAKTTEINDVAISNQNSNFLNEYSAIPWQHYVAKPAALLDDELFFIVKNNFSGTAKSVKSDATIFDENQTSIFEFSDDNNFINGGTYLEKGLKHSAFTEFPTNSNDSASFEIMSFISSGVDELLANDTTRFTQIFYNYYAYDDGTAETGYGLLNSDNGQVALEFTTLKEDTLRAVQMYFNQSLDKSRGIDFDLTIWKDSYNSTPVVQQAVTTEYYGINKFATYKLETPLVIEGTFYVGWTKKSEDYLNIGLDRNDTLNNKLFFNTRVWSPSNISGSPMIRPVFGNDFAKDTTAKPIARIGVFPNPAENTISIDESISIDKVEVYNSYGSLLLEKEAAHQLDISDLSAGLYFIKIYSGNNVYNKRFVKL